MKKFIFSLILSLLISFSTFAKTIEQKKDELQKIYKAGGISKIEYQKAVKFLEKSTEDEKKEKKKKQSFSLKNQSKEKDKDKDKNIKKEEDKEVITQEKIDELGEIVKFDKSYYPPSMIKEFRGHINSFKKIGDKAGGFLYRTFTKSKGWGQRNPGKMIQAMGMYEIFYASKLYKSEKILERYKANEYKDDFFSKKKKKKDEEEIRSLISINKGIKNMREALGMTMETSQKEAIKKFWLLGEFLNLGVGVKNKKLDKDLKERQKLLEAYKVQIANLKKKLQDDLDEEENAKSVE